MRGLDAVQEALFLFSKLHVSRMRHTPESTRPSCRTLSFRSFTTSSRLSGVHRDEMAMTLRAPLGRPNPCGMATPTPVTPSKMSFSFRPYPRDRDRSIIFRRTPTVS